MTRKPVPAKGATAPTARAATRTPGSATTPATARIARSAPAAGAAKAGSRAAAKPVSAKASPKTAAKVPARAAVKPAAKAAVKAAPKAARKPAGPVAKAAAKPAAKSAPGVRNAVRALVKAGRETPAAGRTRAAAATPAAPDTARPMLVRDSFTMPDEEYAVLATVKQACLKAGFEIKKSELLRIGVALVGRLDLATLRQVLDSLPQLKTGRPPSQ
ncbi:hypothetical protein ACFPOU_08950 [Massilia jejuensis]|uniref:Histone H1/5 n=1 Tax=Massilia jejuensis TaxID=648894 RepID=A0ABW0PGW3_9BURK